MRFKKKLKNIVSYILVAIITTIILATNRVYADEGIINYDGPVTKSGSTVGLFHINGRLAFCMDHAKESPSDGTAIAQQSVYADSNVIKCLYYGWEGPKQWSGFGTDWEYGVVATTLAIDHFVNGGTRPVAQDFISFVENSPIPRTELNFSTTSFIATVRDGKQVTNSATINGNEGISLKFTIPADVTIVCENGNWSKTGGTVEVKNGDTMHFEAPITKTGNWTSEQIANSYVWNAILSRTYNANMQRIVRLGEKDPRNIYEFFNKIYRNR